jgi:hypothetical protein
MSDAVLIILGFMFWFFVLRWLWHRGWQPFIIVW